MKNKKLVLIFLAIVGVTFIIFLLVQNKVIVAKLPEFTVSKEVVRPKTQEEIKNEQEELQKNLIEDIKTQSEADIRFSETTYILLKKYPWFSKFPLLTKEYLVVYDYERESFRIVFYTTYSQELEMKIVNRIKSVTKLNQINYYIK